MVSCPHVRPALLVATFMVLAILQPWTLAGQLVGSPAAETYGHAWVRWWTAGAWPALPLGTDLAAGAKLWPVIDPLPTWLCGGLARLVGDTAAWNIGVAGGVLTTSLGGAALAKSMGGSPIFGAIATPIMPIYLGSIQSGLTEDHFLGVVAFSLAAAIERRWIAAGIWTGLASWCGLYLGWFAGMSLLVVAAFEVGKQMWKAVRSRSWPTERRAPALALTALGLAAGLSLAAAWPFFSRLGGPDPQRPPAAVEPLYVLNPWRGADALSFVKPGKVQTGSAIIREHPTYFGITTVGLALAGGWHPAGLAVAVLAGAALGDDVSVGGHPTGINNPVAPLLHAIPLGGHFRNHARLMLLGQLLLVALASRGVARIGVPKFALATTVGAGVLVAAETWFVSPAALPLAHTSTESPAIYAQLPADARPVRVFGEPNAQKPFFDQRFHGYPLKNDPNRPHPGAAKPASEIVVAFPSAVDAMKRELGPANTEISGAAAWWPPGAQQD